MGELCFHFGGDDDLQPAFITAKRGNPEIYLFPTTVQEFNAPACPDGTYHGNPGRPPPYHTPHLRLSTPPYNLCREKKGEINKFSISSPIAGNRLEGRIYLPPCYHAGAPEGYPVLYLLHGVTASDEQWDQLGVDESMDSMLAQGDIPPFLIVMPREPSWALPPENPFDETIVNELIPWVDTQYNTRSDRSHRAIGGLSRGGNWALHIGSKYWQLFAAVGGHSAPIFFGEVRDIPAWLDDIPDEDVPRVFLDIGEDDQNQASVRELERKLTELGIPHEWYLYPGTHNDSYWQGHLEEYLRWYASPWMTIQGKE